MTCIAVVGCYRSGTSAIAGVLHNLGVHMGDHFDPPARNNEHGFWEDLEFKEIHSMLSECKEAVREQQLLVRYNKLIQKRKAEFALWGVKDPLLCGCLPYLADAIGSDIRVVVCRRDPAAITQSLIRGIVSESMEYQPEAFRQLTQKYLETMEKSLSQYSGPILELQHEETMKNPKLTVDSLAAFAGVQPSEAAYEHIRV